MVARYFTRERIEGVCDLFSLERDGVLKVAIMPSGPKLTGNFRKNLEGGGT